MMAVLRRVYALLSPSERRDAWQLLVLMVVGMVVDTLGIGLVIPAIAVLIESDIAATHPRFAPLIAALGHPTQAKLVAGAMLLLVAAYVLRTAFLAFLAWRQAGFAYGVQAELSRRLLAAYLDRPWTFHLQRNSAQLIRNATREVEFFTLHCLLNVLIIATEGLVALGVIALLLVVEPVGTVAVASLLGAGAWVLSVITRPRLARWGLARQVHDGARLQRLQEALGGAKEVMLLGRETEFLRRYDVDNTASAALARRQATVLQVPRIWLELLAVLGLAVLLLTMLARGRELATLVPALGLFAIAGFRLMPSVNRVLTAVQGFRYGRPTIDVLSEELREAGAAPRAPGRRRLSMGFERELRLDGVSYQYPGAAVPALRDVTVQIRSGEAVGIIGASGAGKSTMVDICLGLLTPVSGSVLVDGVDIRQDPRSWQDQIGYVPQSVYLTDDTIRRNVAFGVPDAGIDDAAVWRALRESQLADFVEELPDQLNAIVGERGTSLSGGQRQRIGIARALYGNPPILVLDEATSALDTATERGVLQAVNALRGQKTLLIVTHRLSTVAGCDRIIRIDGGRVVADGPPALLLDEPRASHFH